jgi:GT2 family glycosyltransferase
MIDRVGVVIPAHNEEALLTGCLNAVGLAASLLPDIAVHVVVVLDRCDDGSHAIAARHEGFTVVTVDAGNVGIARAAGVESVLKWAEATPDEWVWLATTDADSIVPADWLVGQVALANAGWEVVVGTVDVVDWSEHPDEVGSRWSASYHPVERHAHIHGANLGCTADAYLEAGGWPPLAVNEDVALIEALAHRRILRTATLPVITSARRDPRAAGGFGDTLRSLAG